MAETILTPEDIEEPQSRAEAWARLIYNKMAGGGSSTSDKELMAETILTPEDIEEPQSRAEAWARLIYDKMTGGSSGGESV